MYLMREYILVCLITDRIQSMAEDTVHRRVSLTVHSGGRGGGGWSDRGGGAPIFHRRVPIFQHGNTVNVRSVRILLECILVLSLSGQKFRNGVLLPCIQAKLL